MARRPSEHLRFALPLVLLAALATIFVVATAGNAAATAAPQNTSPPTLTGTPMEGSTLDAYPGQYSGTTPITYSFLYRRCDKNGGSCANIEGTTALRTYKLTSADVGNTIRVRVIAKNSDGSTTATSVPTAVIKAATAPAPTVVNGCPSGSGPIDVSKLSLPARLSIDGETSSPSLITRSTQQLVLRFHVSACNGRSVQGALVYATAIPFEQFTIPPEASTDANGYASLTLQQAGRFPASPVQQLLAVFVRARKPGDPLTGGVSTRLLVSFRVSLR